MNGKRMSQLLEDYKHRFKNGDVDTTVLEPMRDWTLYVKRYTENGKTIVEIQMELPGDLSGRDEEHGE